MKIIKVFQKQVQMKPVKVWESFKSIAGFNDTKNKKRCWQQCHSCKKKWQYIDTTNVHMVTHQNPENCVNGNFNFFVCDDCLSKIKANGNNITEVQI